MLKYYEINGKTCFTDHMDFQCPPEADWKEIPEPRTAEELSWLFFRTGELPRLLPGES